MKSSGMPRIASRIVMIPIVMIVMSQGCVENRTRTGEAHVRQESVTTDSTSIQDPQMLTLDAAEKIDFSVNISCEIAQEVAKISLRITNRQHESIAFLPNLLDLQIMPSTRDVVIWDSSPLSLQVALDTSSRNQLQIGMYEPLIKYRAIAERDLQFIRIHPSGAAVIVFVVKGDSLIYKYRSRIKHVFAEAGIPLWSQRDSGPWKVIEKNLCAGSPAGKYEVRIDSATGNWQVMNQTNRRYRVSESEYDCLVSAAKGPVQGDVFLTRRVVAK